MTLKQSSKANTAVVTTPTTKLPITTILQVTEDASAYPTVDGVSQSGGMAYCSGSTLVNTSGRYDDFEAAHGSLVLPNGPFKTNVVDDTDLAITVTGATLSTLALAEGYAYSDVSGDWWFTFVISGTISPSDSSFSVVVDGITFKNTAGAFQAVAHSGPSGSRVAKGYCSPGTGDIVLNHEATESTFRIAGTASLESKPTWADANLESYPTIALFDNAGANVLGIPAATATAAGTVSAEESDSAYSFTVNGFSDISSVVGGYSIVGKQATIFLPIFDGTSNSTSFSITLPAFLQRSAGGAGTIYFATPRVKDNGSITELGRVGISVSGTSIDVRRSTGGSTWTASGTKGLPLGLAITYILD